MAFLEQQINISIAITPTRRPKRAIPFILKTINNQWSNFNICWKPTEYFISYESSIFLIIPSLVIIIREIVITSFRQFLAENQGFNPIKVTLLAKSKTTIQIFAVSFLIISPNFGQLFWFLTVVLFWSAAYVSMHSMYGYVKNYRNFLK